MPKTKGETKEGIQRIQIKRKARMTKSGQKEHKGKRNKQKGKERRMFFFSEDASGEDKAGQEKERMVNNAKQEGQEQMTNGIGRG